MKYSILLLLLMGCGSILPPEIESVCTEWRPLALPESSSAAQKDCNSSCIKASKQFPRLVEVMWSCLTYSCVCTY